MELNQLHNSPKQARNGYGVQIFEFEHQILHQVHNFSQQLLFSSKISVMRVPSNFVINPLNINNGHNEQYYISKEANRRK